MNIKQILRTLPLVAAASFLIIIVSAQQALGLECAFLPDDICASSEEGDLEDSGTWRLLLWILGIVTAGIGVTAVAMIGYFGFLYATAGDNSKQTEEAKGNIRNTIVGLVLYGLMYLGLQFLIPGGVFTT